MLADMRDDPLYAVEGDGPPPWAVFPEGLRRVETLPTLTEAFLVRGWGERETAMVLGGNALRVLRAALP
jgi:microsomal dipeptidase-like Zn-dependent dipeptidase